MDDLERELIEPASIAPVSDRAPDEKPPHVLFFARKTLLRNTRIFKQVDSLNRAGYHVTLIGILPVGGVPYEEHDGVTIHRLRLNPLYARLPRRIRAAAYRIQRSVAMLPGRYVRVANRLRPWARRPYRIARSRTRRLLEATGIATAWRYVDDRLSGRSLPLEGSPGARPSPALFLPLVPAVLLHRLFHALGNAMAAPVRKAQETWKQRRGSGRRQRILRLLRAAVRGEERVLRGLVEFTIARIQAVLKPFTMPLRSVEYYRLAGRMSRELPAPDVVHANDLDALFVAALVARRHRVPLVYDAQELYVGLHTLAGWYRRWLTFQERVLIRRADRVTAVNEAVAGAMEQKYHRRVDEVILNCPPLTPLPAGGSSNGVRAELGLDPGQLLLLYSGGLTPRRGLTTLVLALEQLEGVHLVLLGEGRLRAELEELAVGRGLNDRISFTPFVHHLEVPHFIASADIGIIPYENSGLNHYLASPSKLFHYIMAGLPIACSDFPFLRTVVVENEIGMVFDPSDPSSVAASVRALAGPEVRAAIKERLEKLRDFYSWEEQERRFLAVYDSVVDPHRTGRGDRASASRLGYSGRAVYDR